MRRIKFLLLAIAIPAIFIFIPACNQINGNDNHEIEKLELSIPMDITLDELSKYANTAPVVIEYDPAFKKAMEFEAFSLKEALRAIGVDQLENREQLEITFICTDGFAPKMPLEDALVEEGFVSYQGDEEQLRRWPKEKRKRVPPYYLAWQGMTPKNNTLMNPYGLVKIKIDFAKMNRQFSFPETIQADSLLSEGYQLFEATCGKCHSMNKEGGHVGPELNYPKNITEYRSKEFMKSFVNNPKSYRYNSIMPAMGFSDEQFDLVYNYLVAMKDYKID